MSFSSTSIFEGQEPHPYTYVTDVKVIGIFESLKEKHGYVDPKQMGSI